MPRIEQYWVQRSETQAVFDALEQAGGRAWFVGGCVRDALLGSDVTDIDIATDLTPESTQTSAEAAGMRAIPTGVEHGTVTVLCGDLAYEVTTMRRDVATDGRRAVVAFSTDIKDDARRRDFTINALYADRGGTVLDPLGTGLADLRARRVVFIGNPVDRIGEDYLRILRYFRFFATHADMSAGVDETAMAAIADMADGIGALSRERIGHEMLKLLAASDPAPAVAAMATAGVLAQVLPGADPKALGPLVHIEQSIDRAPDPILRLAALGGQDTTAKLRLSRTDAQRLDRIRSAAMDGQTADALGYRLGANGATDALILRAALMEAPVERDVIERAEFGAQQVFPVSAADLMPAYKGPALGARLADLETRWIASGFTLSKAELLASD